MMKTSKTQYSSFIINFNFYTKYKNPLTNLQLKLVPEVHLTY